MRPDDGITRSWADLGDREQALGIRPGQPFLLPPDGTPDAAVLRYMNGVTFKRLAPNSQLAYAYDLRVHLSYLTSQGVDWRNATEDDLLGYAAWRMQSDENPRRVTATKFSRELASCRRFYEWQRRRGVIDQSPVEVVQARLPDGRHVERIPLRPRGTRVGPLNWWTTSEFREWCRVGLRGNTRRKTSRNRNVARSIAFAETLWATGLRLREAGSLLLPELPRVQREYQRGRLAAAVAKTSGRDYWISRDALAAIRAYKISGRDAAVRRARAAGRYDDIPGVMILQSVNSRRQLIYTNERGEGGRVPFDNLTAEQRRAGLPGKATKGLNQLRSG